MLCEISFFFHLKIVEKMFYHILILIDFKCGLIFFINPSWCKQSNRQIAFFNNTSCLKYILIMRCNRVNPVNSKLQGQLGIFSVPYLCSIHHPHIPLDQTHQPQHKRRTVAQDQRLLETMPDPYDSNHSSGISRQIRQKILYKKQLYKHDWHIIKLVCFSIL